jgi:hypothetical protein
MRRNGHNIAFILKGDISIIACDEVLQQNLRFLVFRYAGYFSNYVCILHFRAKDIILSLPNKPMPCFKSLIYQSLVAFNGCWLNSYIEK